MFARGYQSWWVWAIRGCVAIMFGIIEFLYPAPTLILAVLLYGAFNKIDGLLSIMISAYWLGTTLAIPLIAAGMVGVLTGIIALLWPSLDDSIIAVTLGALAIVRGGLETVHAIRLRPWISNARATIVAASLIGAYGIIILVGPAIRLRALVITFAAYVSVAGLCHIMTAIRLRNAEQAAMARSQAQIG